MIAFLQHWELHNEINQWSDLLAKVAEKLKYILANFQISERGTNERKKFKKRNIPKFPIHYYTKIAAKTGTHDKIILFFASKRGTVPPKEEQLASMEIHQVNQYCLLLA